jgi:hypothetical protein
LVVYIVGKNLCRRDMTAGQKAMALACIYPKSQQGKRTDLLPTSSNLEEVAKSLQGRLSEARAILGWSRTKATDVLNGALPFDLVAADHQLTRASYTALQRSWMLNERAFGQSASVSKRSVSLASPCCSISRATL